ncbi:Ig-like domain-containing protein [Roseburia hominis]
MDRKMKMLLIFLTICVICCCKYGYAHSMRNVVAADNEEAAGIDEEIPDDDKAGSDVPPDLQPTPEIKGYRVQYEKAEGENGYYLHMPQIMLFHQDLGFETHYCLVYPDGRKEEGVLKGEESSKKWSGLDGDGIWKLQVELVPCETAEWPYGMPLGIPCETDSPEKDEGEGEENGKENESTGGDEEQVLVKDTENQQEDVMQKIVMWKKEYCWKVDGTVPVLQVVSPKNTEVWYQKAITVKLAVFDEGSGIKSFEASCGGKKYSSKSKKDLSFLVQEESRNGQPVNVSIKAVDLAGNSVQKNMKLYIDRTGPQVTISGVGEYQISNKTIKAIFSVKDNNKLLGTEAILEQTLPDGEKKTHTVDTWADTSKGKRAEITLEQDGIYKLILVATDIVGNTSTMDRQVIIDQTPPALCLPEGIAGSVRREFNLEKELDKLATDFTTVSIQAELDGKLFYPGKAVKREGKHTLFFKAVDAAGNISEQRAEFRIDRTAPVIQIIETGTKKEVSDGDIYEEELQLQIMTEDSADQLRTIWVNGVRQKKMRNGVFSNTLKEPGPYEIQAEACDAAGNISNKMISIQVTDAKTTLDKLSDPAMNLFQRFSGSSGKGGRKAEAGVSQVVAVGILVFGILTAGCAIVVVRLKKCLNREEEERYETESYK